MKPSTPFILADAARALAQQKKQTAAAPSARNQEIFQRVVIHCEKQSDVAADFDITPSRVSHIVARVRQWLAEGGQGDPETLSHQQQQRLERSLARARHEAIYNLTLRAAIGGAPVSGGARVSQPRTAQSRKVRETHLPTANPQPENCSPPCSPSSVPCPLESTLNLEPETLNSDNSPPPLNVQLIKTAQRSAIELQKLAELDPLPEPQSQRPTEYELFSALYDLLCDRRRHAESQGHVMQSKDVPDFIEHLLGALLGYPIGYDGLGSDPAARDLVRTFLLGPLPTRTSPSTSQFLSDLGCDSTPLPPGESGALSEPGDGSPPANSVVPPPRTPNPLILHLPRPLVRFPHQRQDSPKQDSAKTHQLAPHAYQHDNPAPDPITSNPNAPTPSPPTTSTTDPPPNTAPTHPQKTQNMTPSTIIPTYPPLPPTLDSQTSNFEPPTLNLEL
jgi:hypothetical protein